MFHLVTQWGQIPSWKMKWGVDGAFHFFFFWGTAEAKSRRQIFTYTVKFWSKSRVSLIFFPLPSWLTHILYKSVLPLLLLRTNLFLHLLASPGFTPAKNMSMNCLGGKINQPFASGRLCGFEISCCDASNEEKLNIIPNSQRIVFVHFNVPSMQTCDAQPIPNLDISIRRPLSKDLSSSLLIKVLLCSICLIHVERHGRNNKHNTGRTRIWKVIYQLRFEIKRKTWRHERHVRSAQVEYFESTKGILCVVCISALDSITWKKNSTLHVVYCSSKKKKKKW